ncbi:MAG TPA: fibronectin type III domain-containing protein [Phycisphaerales bacterium]|nr:fibronectin type III domain-containing protein [Phycisphaerales bacterium]
MSKVQRIVRAPRLDALNFALAHQTPFQTGGASIGLSPTMVTNYVTAVTDFNDAMLEVQSLKDQLKVASAKASAKFRIMNTTMTATVAAIDAFAAASANPQAVWDASQLIPPQNPSQMPPPGTPDTFRATLNPDGSVKISWQCKNPPGSTGTVYIIRRRLLNSQVWSQVGVTAARNFTDASIPSASGGAVYQVTAQRGASQGDASTPFTLQFGVDGGGNLAITGLTGGKLAA